MIKVYQVEAGEVIRSLQLPIQDQIVHMAWWGAQAPFTWREPFWNVVAHDPTLVYA